jgi:hypothetical protein
VGAAVGAYLCYRKSIPDQPGDRPSQWPLAFLITFSCYGNRVHAEESGTVDREHNVPGTPYLNPYAGRAIIERGQMKFAPLRLDRVRRRVVLDSICESCAYRDWPLFAAHVRSTHVHVVVAGAAKPERMMGILKARASRKLTDDGLEARDRVKWAVHGSTRWLWNECDVFAAVDYVLAGQGDAMEVYRGTVGIGRY